MKHIRKKIVAAVLCAALCLALAGCTPAGQGLPWNSAGAAPEDRMAIPSLLRPFDLPLNPSLREKYRSK